MILKYFFGDWCWPCKVSKPAVQKAIRETEWADIELINVDTQQKEMQEYSVRSLPTMVFVSDEWKMLDKIVWARSYEQMCHYLSNNKHKLCDR